MRQGASEGDLQRWKVLVVLDEQPVSRPCTLVDVRICSAGRRKRGRPQSLADPSCWIVAVSFVVARLVDI